MAAEVKVVRPAGTVDLPRMLDIYNHEVRLSTATYDTRPRSLPEQEEWFTHHGPGHPVLVAEEGGYVTGWASLSPWSDRPAYDRSVEVSVYVAEEHRGKGYGKLLLQALIDAARSRGHHALLARISADNTVSILLHRKLGFTEVGLLKEVGHKFGRMLDVSIMELILDRS
jgi:phosphinothricin acetyltransferase